MLRSCRGWLGDVLWSDAFNWLLPIRVRFAWWRVCWAVKGGERF